MRGSRPTWIAFAVFAAVMGALSLARYETFHSRSLDMAYYIRLVWGLAHGHYDQPVVNAPHLLGLHLEPILLPFALLARLRVPIAELLLVAQALATAAVIFPAAALARRHVAPVAGPRAAFLTALAVYLYPSVTRCVDYDFHPSTMVIWPLLAFVEALDAKRFRAATLWCLAALAFREDVGLQVGCVALTVVLFPLHRVPGERLWAIAVATLGFAWFFSYVFFVQPRFLPDAGSYSVHFGRFGGAGGAQGILAASLSDPLGLLRYLASEDRLIYPLLLLCPLALLPLAAPRWLAGALPLLAINLLSDFPGVRSIQAHYITAAVPFLVASALVGCARLAPRLHYAPHLLLASSLFAFALRGASPASPEWRWDAYQDDDYSRKARADIQSIAQADAVTAPSRILAHVAERPVVHRGPTLEVAPK